MAAGSAMVGSGYRSACPRAGDVREEAAESRRSVLPQASCRLVGSSDLAVVVVDVGMPL